MVTAKSQGSELGSDVPTPVPAAGLHQCTICFKSYKRREHLYRHTNSHTAERPYRCPACNCAFQRADVLKRHWRTCDGGGFSRSVARRRACDRCVRQKKACNSAQPCQNCEKRGIACNYSAGAKAQKPTSQISSHPIDIDKDTFAGDASMPDIETIVPSAFELGHFDTVALNPFDSFFEPDLFDYSSPTWQDILHPPPSDEGSRELVISGTDVNPGFRFLDNFTSKTGFIMSFDCGTLRQRQEIMSNIQRGVLVFEPQEALMTSFDPVSMLEGVSSGWLNDPLALKTHQIILSVKEVVTIKPRNSPVTLSWSPALEQMCLQFFSPINLRKYLELYWAIWSPNVNFVHRPTFDPVASKSCLVASMALIGAHKIFGTINRIQDE